MPSFFASHGDQDSEPTSIDGTEYESASQSSQEPEDEKEEAKEDMLKSEQELSAVITTNAKGKSKSKGIKKSWWWRRSWSKNSDKTTHKKKKKNKKHKKKRKGKGKYTLSMQSHHHATFAHLTHDAFLRLKCSPVHRSGYTHMQIVKNIEKHYRLKLGKKFKVRLQLSLERLVRKGLLVPLGSKDKYKPSEAFLAQFSRLKVIDGASNHRFGLVIHKYKSRRGNSPGTMSRIRRRSRKRKRRKRKRRRRKRRRKRRRGKRRGRKGQGQSHHHPQPERKQHSHTSHRSKKTTSQKGSSSTNSNFGDSIIKWFWPSKDDNTDQEKNDKSKALDEETENNYSSQSCLRKIRRVPISRKRKHAPGRGLFSHVKGARYRRFNRLQIRERAEKPVFPTPEGSIHWSDEFSHLVSKASDNSDNETPPTSMSPIDEDDYMSDTTSEASRPKDKSRKEHDILHAMKESSKGYARRRSFLERVSDTLRGAFGTMHTSTTTCEGGPSKPQKFSKSPPKSQRLFKTRPKSSGTCAIPTPISGRSCDNSMVATPNM